MSEKTSLGIEKFLNKHIEAIHIENNSTISGIVFAVTTTPDGNIFLYLNNLGVIIPISLLDKELFISIK